MSTRTASLRLRRRYVPYARPLLAFPRSDATAHTVLGTIVGSYECQYRATNHYAPFFVGDILANGYTVVCF